MDIDELWPGGPRFIRSDAAFALGTDSVLLSAFTDTSRAKHACDLGCGSGIISIILAWNNPGLSVDGVELQPEPAALAKQNVSLCGLDDRVNIIDGDLRKCREFLTAGAYDLVFSNPPYFAQGRGKPASSKVSSARDERNCTITDLCTAAAYLTRWGGRFSLVHRPERTAELICALCAAGLEPKRIRFVQHKADSEPNLVLIESRRGGKPSLKVEPPLILAYSDGNPTDEILRIYHKQPVSRQEENL